MCLLNWVAFPDIETVALENGKSVIVLRVPGGAAGLYTYDGRPHIRSCPTTSIMPKTEYERRVVERLHATRRWENEPAAGGISIKDLDQDEIHLILTNPLMRAE